MRIGSTVLFKELQCYQSYLWSMFRPLGVLQGVLNSLEAYQCDEVTIIRPVRNNDDEDRFYADIQVIKSLNSMTPISFGGGIRTKRHLDLLLDLPVERLVFSSAFISKNTDLLKYATDLFGHQAIQCLLPVRVNHEILEVFVSSSHEFIPFSALDSDYIDSLANEIIIYDINNEGNQDGFNFEFLQMMPFSSKKLVITGGVGHQSIRQAKRLNLASSLIDNKVLHKEYSLAGLKHAK